MPEGYQLNLRLDGRLAVVVGGGTAAADQVARLRAAGASVLVVAAELSAPLSALAARGEIAVRQGHYQPTDLNGSWMAVACSMTPAVNAAVAADAGQRGLWCVTAGEPGSGGPVGPRRVLVLGGARSGKSTTAERFLAGHDAVEYVATGLMPGDDDAEWAARVALHRARRPPHWRTNETTDLESVLSAADPAAVLIDCLSLWLTRVLDECGAWDAPGDVTAADRRISDLLEAWRATSRTVVAVSNEVGAGVVPATASGRLFRDTLGRLNAAVAADSDEVWFCTAGLPRRLR